MTRKKFPKTIMLDLSNNPNRYFFSKRELIEKLYHVLVLGLQSKKLDDIMGERLEIPLPITTHYSHFGKTGHLSIINFKTENIEGKIEIKHWGTWDGGQMESAKIIIEKLIVPKVVFS
jgi:hypothetical protein